MDEFDPALISFTTTMATKSAEAPAHTFNTVWQLIFGKLDFYLEKKKIKWNHDLKVFAESLDDKIKKVPDENIQEPKVSIIGPVLEATKYYLDEEELRECFANLLISSLDDRQNNIIHHAFVDIVKQLDPLDARNLKVISKVKNDILPVANYYYRTENGNKKILKKLVFLENKEQININMQSSSLQNLQRLGLIEIDFTTFLTKEGSYQELDDNIFAELYKEDLGDRFETEHGILRLTQFGQNFCSVCLSAQSK